MKRRYKILIHLAFWVYMLNQTFFGILLMPSEKHIPFPSLFISYFSGILTFYALYCSIGYIFGNDKKTTPVIILIFTLFALVPVRIGIEFYLWRLFGTQDALEGKQLVITASLWFNSIRMVIIFGIYSLLIQLAIKWYESQRLKTDLLLQTKASELALLRSQIRPHFLFNTLNNIYSLVYTRADDAPEAVMKLSAIMRYMLYDATADVVSLEKEIDYLNSFIALENIRLRQKDFVAMTVSGSIETQTIAPMILIPFVENAFKHGNKNCPVPGITIDLFVDPRWIQFEVSNYLRPPGPINGDTGKGIGLQNVRRRLELLYGDHFKLETDQTRDKFSVLLILWK